MRWFLNFLFILLTLTFISPLQVFAFSGAGTSGDPYQITTAAELASLSSYLGSGNSGKYFKLMNDIDLNVSPYNTGTGWTPIGTSANNFYAKFDGDYKVISNIYINGGSSDYLGLFGVVGTSGIVQNVVISNPNISGDYAVGALAGSNKGTVTKSGVRNGSVTGVQRLGGLIGENSGGITQSFASTTVYFTPGGSATCCAGGLAGEVAFGGSSAIINNSYSKSAVIISASIYNQGSIGGVLGNDYSSGAKSNLYATGPITMVSGNFPSNVGGLSGGTYTSITSSYWDTQTTGRSTSNGGAGVVGKTTSQMKDQSTYSGWDFSTIWGISASINDGYPYLLWTPAESADSTVPTASTTAPDGGSIVSGSSVTLSANATDNVAVSGVSFYINGVLQGSEDTSAPYSVTWNSTATTSGSKTILSVARDSSSNYATSSSVTFTVDNDAPTVSLSSPTANEATTSVMTLTASASDTHSSVSGVKFYIDGALQGSEDVSAPYSITYDTTATTSGSHVAIAVARDAAGNVATSSSVTFTVSNTGTTPSGVLVTGTSNGGIFTWTTSSNASSRVWFGILDNVSSSTPESDTSPRVTSHSVTVSGLPSCTRYHYVVSGMDALLNSATSTDSTFTTGGCTGSASITSSEVDSVTNASGGTVTNGTATIVVPASFTNVTSTAVFQIHEINADNFYSSAGVPTGKTRSQSSVYNFKALVDATTTISSFSSPLTVTLSYEQADIEGIEESSLVIYRYDGSEWHALSNCSVDQSANTVTCETGAFSDFAIFGSADSSSGSSRSSRTVHTIQSQVSNLLKMGKTNEAKRLEQEWPHLFATNIASASNVNMTSSAIGSVVSASGEVSLNAVSSSTVGSSTTTTTVHGAVFADVVADGVKKTITFTRDLDMWDTGNDVKILQEFLIKNNLGEAGKELAGVGATGFFGLYTKKALGEFQRLNNIYPSKGHLGPATRALIEARLQERIGQ